MASGNVHHDPRTVAALVDSSERACRILDTVRPPRENARSTSVELAKNNVSQRIKAGANHAPGIERKSRAICASGWPVASSPVQYVIGSTVSVNGGLLIHSLIGSSVATTSSSR